MAPAVSSMPLLRLQMTPPLSSLALLLLRTRTEHGDASVASCLCSRAALQLKTEKSWHLEVLHVQCLPGGLARCAGPCLRETFSSSLVNSTGLPGRQSKPVPGLLAGGRIAYLESWRAPRLGGRWHSVAQRGCAPELRTPAASFPYREVARRGEPSAGVSISDSHHQ